MSNPEFKLDDNAPTVSWADPKNAGSSAASQVCCSVIFCSPFYVVELCSGYQKS
jgi:hypothetical protein